MAALVTICGSDMLQDAVANGDTRTLTLHHVHSGESATVTFKRNGRYDPAALQQLNILLQDWRRKEPTKMDPQLFDIVWEVYRELDATQPIQVIGGYRSPATNAMLRARSRGVAQTSLHMQGKAMDFYIPGVPLAAIREAGLRLQRGGVGFYPTSGSPFVHLDTGGIRHWPRMTRDQLARVFPNGKTVHIPADGRPMSGYALALAEVESRGNRPGGAGAAFAGVSTGSGSKKSLLATLFGKDGDDDDDSGTPAATAEKPTAAEVAAAAPASAPAVAAAASVVAAADVPTPLPNPARPQFAAASAVAAPTATPVAAIPFDVAAAVPIPLARPGEAPARTLGAEPPGQTMQAQTMVVAAADPETTASVPTPLARPQNAGLPALIVRGSQQDEPLAPTLSYASAAEFVVARPSPGRAPEPAAIPLPQNDASRHLSPHSQEAQAEIRRLFSSPTVAADTTLRTPELRRFAAFVAPPRLLVDGGFGRDASSGLVTTRFSGAAVVAIPVVAASVPTPPKRRLSMVNN